MNMRLKLSPILLIRTVITVSLLCATLIHPTAVFSQPPTLVVTEKVTEHEFHDQITLIGRTSAISTSQVVSIVPGRVSSIDALEGARVESGAALVSLNSAKVRLRHMAKKAEAAQAKARADLATANLKRAEKLFGEAGISESQLDERRTEAASALEFYNQLSAEERELKIDLTNCTISAPYSGYTVRQLVNVGEWVAIGDPVFEMVDLSTVKVVVDLPEKYFGQLTIGSKVTVVVSDNSAQPIPGVVTGVAPNASQTTHTFPVYVTVDNSDERIGGGMLVRVTLNLNEKFTSLAVSKDAIVRQGPMEQIYTIVEGNAAPIMVRTGSSSGNLVAVSGEGLANDMVVIVRGNERVFPGSPVRTAGQGGPHQGGPTATEDSEENSAATGEDSEDGGDS